MKGFYFINTDIRNRRAHTCQILNTAAAIGAKLPLDIVAPKYHKEEIELELIKNRHNLPAPPRVAFLGNFGIKNPGAAAFILFNIPSILFLFRKKIRKEAAFVYVRSGLFLPLAVFAYILHIPCFYETHRKPISLSEQFYDYIMSKTALGIITISEHMKEHYLPHKKKMLVVHDAVSLERFADTTGRKEAREKLDLSPDKSICLYAGTVSKLKGVDYVFGAARLLPKVLFLLVGAVSGEFAGESLPPNVKLLGKKEQRELPLFFRAADALLLPHPKGEYSQSPMKLFEYMASGTPIVSSRLPSILEILNENNAILVEAESGEALAAGIKKALSDKSFSEAAAERAREDAQNYTWESRGDKIAAFVRRVLPPGSAI